MKRAIYLLSTIIMISGCNQNDKPATSKNSSMELADFFEKYHEEALMLFPLNATIEGDSRYNDQLAIDFTDSYRQKTKAFYQKYLDQLKTYDREQLSAKDQLSYDIFKYTMDINIEGYKFP